MKALAIALIAIPTLGHANPITVGASLGLSETKIDSDNGADPTRTYGIFGRLGFSKRVSGQLELMRYKSEYGFSPKNYREREVPIPAKLVKKLKTAKAKAGTSCGLVFPTAGCRPKLDFLDTLKAVAERAKLNPKSFWLHKFRATFATWSLWAGVDLRTVQQWLGHSDMESTMRYLKPSRSQQVRQKVNRIFG